MAAQQIKPNLDQHLLYKDVADFEYGLPVTGNYCRDPDSGLIIQYPIPEQEKLPSLYPDNYRPYITKGLVNLLKTIQAMFLATTLKSKLQAPNESILEIGCGGGHLLIQLKKLGFKNLTALDWNSGLEPHLESHGIHFVEGNVESEINLPSTYDNIIMNNVIEHFAHPDIVLRKLKDVLKPNGKFIIITPNEGSLCHKVFGRDWSGLHAPRHIFIFNPESAERFAKQLGYFIECELLSDPSGWAVSIQNYIRRVFRASPPFTGTSWYTKVLLPFCFIPAIIEHFLDRSSSMLICLRQNTNA
jgi:2-polyprenyl-3-methyl-5-hydroxy-6-metoxy-1,4-benzoquinol methylase